MTNRPDDARALVHQVNNLLGVVYAQVAVARADGSAERALDALKIIEDAAKATDAAVRAFRREQAREAEQ